MICHTITTILTVVRGSMFPIETRRVQRFSLQPPCSATMCSPAPSGTALLRCSNSRAVANNAAIPTAVVRPMADRLRAREHSRQLLATPGANPSSQIAQSGTDGGGMRCSIGRDMSRFLNSQKGEWYLVGAICHIFVSVRQRGVAQGNHTWQV